MKSNSFSRRGLVMGAVTLAATRLKGANETFQQVATTEAVSKEALTTPPYAY